MKKILLPFSFVIFANVYSQNSNCNMPFPHHTKYNDGVILPSVDGICRDSTTLSFFKEWKDEYIRYKKYGDEQCAFVYSKDTRQDKNKNKDQDYDCVSEAMGYGMIIVVLMTNNENSQENRQIFNQLFKFYERHPSKRDKEGLREKERSILMGYGIKVMQLKDDVFETSSASDGDIDIAFSLLLANAQWTSNGDINYLKEADTLIKTIYAQDINKHTKLILTSNKNEDDDHIKKAIHHRYYDIRTSDFIPSELKAFNDFTSVVDSCYKYFFMIQSLGDCSVGFVPDFVQHVGDTIQKKKYNIIIPTKEYQETEHDGKYYYNACRVPWRIATDYIISGDSRAKQFLEPINNWIESECDNNPNKINAGYTLDGNVILEANKKDTLMMSFVSPFAVSAMIDKKNQTWLNNLWDCIVKLPLHSNATDFNYGYFENTIKMLNLIIISGNYWSTKNNYDK